MVFHHAQHRIYQGKKYYKSRSQIAGTQEKTVDSVPSQTQKQHLRGTHTYDTEHSQSKGATVNTQHS